MEYDFSEVTSLISSFQSFISYVEHHLTETIIIVLALELVIEIIDRLTKENPLLHYIWKIIQALIAIWLVKVFFEYIGSILKSLTGTIL